MERYFVFFSCDYAEYLFHDYFSTLPAALEFAKGYGNVMDECEREVDWTYKIYDIDFYQVAKGQIDTGVED